MKALSLLFFMLLLTGCSTINPNTFSTFEASDRSDSLKTSRDKINYHGVPLRSGQILVSSGFTPLNFLLSLTDTEFYPYTHAGIISIEQGEPYLYHAIAEVRPLARGSIMDKTKGKIARISLSKYLNDKTVVAIYSLSSPELGKSMADFAIKSYKDGLPYDALFDETDRTKVYCTEFIVQAIESSGGKPIFLRPRSRHPSIDAIYSGLGIKSIKHYFVRDILTDASPVALFSKTLTREQIDLYFALREELYRRFTPDQKMGNIMSWTGLGFAFREPVTVFVDRGLKQDFRKRRYDETWREWVSALANEVFGEVSMKGANSRLSAK